MSLRLVSDNMAQIQIEQLALRWVGLNEAEQEHILSKKLENGIVPVTANLQPYLDRMEELDEQMRPTLKNMAKGPFTLAVVNIGKSPEDAQLSFELRSHDVEEDIENGIIRSSEGFVKKALTMVPLTSVFRKQIEDEAERISRRMKGSTVRDLSQFKLERDIEVVTAMSKAVISSVNVTQNNEKTQMATTGREMVSDNLAGSLSASIAFYDAFWKQLTDLYEPTCRFLGERLAMGQISLKDHKPLRI